jgi:hypothetical protein
MYELIRTILASKNNGLKKRPLFLQQAHFFPAISKQLKVCLLRKHRSKKDDTKGQHEIDDLTKKLDQIEFEITQTDKETSRLSNLIEESLLNRIRLKSN